MEVVEPTHDPAEVWPWYADLPSPRPQWAAPGFEAELRSWCATHVGAVTGATPHKLRFWSTVWRVETADDAFFCKQSCPLQAFEAALTAELAALAPEYVVPVAALDPDRGLLLTPDQGPVFGDTVGDDLDAWVRVAGDGAHLQRQVAAYADRLAGTGLGTLRPEDAPGYLRARVEQLAALPAEDSRRLAGEDAARLRAHLAVVHHWADEVAALGLPITLNHNDLHEHNAFDVDGRLRFFDFGDALLTEPLGVLLIPLNVLAARLEAGPSDPRLHRVADAALEVWTHHGPGRELRVALPAALQLARLGRVESWLRVLASADHADRVEWGDSAAGWLATLLEDPPLLLRR